MKQIGKEILRERNIAFIKERLALCNQKQIQFFHKMYPGGVESLSDDRLANALSQIERTLLKNGVNSHKPDQPNTHLDQS